MEHLACRRGEAGHHGNHGRARWDRAVVWTWTVKIAEIKRAAGLGEDRKIQGKKRFKEPQGGEDICLTDGRWPQVLPGSSDFL